MDHKAESIIVTCIDFRLQEPINKWISQNFPPKTYDRVALAGGVKNLDTILSQIDITHRLHRIKKVILINHEDCGAYGTESTSEKHAQDLKNAASRIRQQFPEVSVNTYYFHLDDTFELMENE